LNGVPPEATEREFLEQPVAQPSRCTAVSNLPSATGDPVKGRGSHLPRNQPGLCNRAPGGVATGAAVDIMLPSVQSATKHLNAPQPSTTPTWFAKLGGDGHSRSHLFCPLARHLSGMHPTHSLDAVVDSLRASELLECRCRPDLNEDRGSQTETAVATKCQDPACAH
jgi:hypothetical protein